MSQEIEVLLKQGMQWFGSNQLDSAVSAFQQVLAKDAHQPLALHFLGLCLHRKGDCQSAIRYLEHSIRVVPHVAPFHNNFGLVLSDLMEFDRALLVLREAIRLDPSSAGTYDNIGAVLQKQGKFDEALQYHQTALEKEPQLIAAANNLATALARLGRGSEAIGLLEKWAQQNVRVPEVYLNLGKCYLQEGRADAAEQVLKHALELRPEYADALNTLAQAAHSQGKWKDAIELLKRSLQIRPGNSQAFLELGNILRAEGNAHDAIDSFRKAISLDPQNFAARWNAALTLPVLYTDQSEVALFRERWKRGINELLSFLNSPASCAGVPVAAPHSNFYLHYQQQNDLDEQKQFGSVVRHLALSHYPDLPPLPTRKGPRQRLRVGFVSHFFNLHTVFKLFHGWIRYLNRELIEIHCFYLGREHDKATEHIRQHCDVFRSRFPSHAATVECLVASKLDVLIYPELGMDPLTLSFAAMRLAPVQCMTWGHPVTSGLETIDYFLSSDLMEAPGAETHYVEKLVRLPNLSICYPPPDTRIAERPGTLRNFQHQKPAFLCLQSLFKLLPDSDDLYPRIASLVPDCEFWFIGLDSLEVTGIFKKRLEAAFQRFGLDAARFVRIFPKMKIGEFFGLVQASDIILDSVGWSGGNTSLEALAFAKPIVTLPGQWMRSRHTYAILRQLGVEETVASDREDYVRIATSLASDVSMRNAVIESIQRNMNRIYNDLVPIRALEKFLFEVQ